MWLRGLSPHQGLTLSKMTLLAHRPPRICFQQSLCTNKVDDSTPGTKATEHGTSQNMAVKSSLEHKTSHATHSEGQTGGNRGGAAHSSDTQSMNRWMEGFEENWPSETEAKGSTPYGKNKEQRITDDRDDADIDDGVAEQGARRRHSGARVAGRNHDKAQSVSRQRHAPRRMRADDDDDEDDETEQGLLDEWRRGSKHEDSTTGSRQPWAAASRPPRTRAGKNLEDDANDVDDADTGDNNTLLKKIRDQRKTLQGTRKDTQADRNSGAADDILDEREKNSFDGRNAATEKKGTRPASSGRRIESDMHVGRSVRRQRISPEELQAYTKIASRFSKRWNRDPWPHGRQDFEFPSLQQIHKLSFSINVMLEVRNAAVPASSHHPSFSRLARHREHIICYTHADTLDQASVERISMWTRRAWPKARVVFLDSREMRADPEPFEELRELVIDAMERKGGYNCALTAGLPNVGKSSVLLGILRELGKKIEKRVAFNMRRTTKEKPSIKDVPGHTRELSQYVLRDAPRLYCLDVPGITPPPIYFQDRPQAWFALAAANCLPIPEPADMEREMLADICEYILFCFNRDGVFDYVKVRLGVYVK